MRENLNKLTLKFFSMLIISMLTISLFSSVTAAKLDDYEQELEQIKKEQKENASKLTGVEKEIAQYTYDIADLDSKMSKYSKELAGLQTKVESVNEKLEEQEQALQNSAQLYNNAEDMYTTRLRAIYENGIPTMLEILLSSKGISDFFSRMNVYNSILEYDRNLVGNIKNQKEYIDYIKKDIEVQKLQLDQLKYDVEKSTKALEDTLQVKQNKMASLNSSKENLQAISSDLTKKQLAAKKKVEDELARIAKEAQDNANNGTGNVFIGDLAWPVPGFYTITTEFGEIYNLVDPNGSAHTGADIASSGINGTPIKAMADGTVTTATYGKYGYGNYVIINHGKNSTNGNIYISLYGHASSLAVSKGQKVTKGQTIAYVGSTGNSTGPHLHFEIYQNGKRVNPLQFYNGLPFKYPYR
ncbi:MAG: peptidoglycan DD-metalloendopeptidase family protein [Clostridia bacterium]|nr:peptidoglycan DD-metalloendopeptidase family protein [Clostridia bacterium]